MAELLPIGDPFATGRRALTAHPADLPGRSDRRPGSDVDVRRGAALPATPPDLRLAKAPCRRPACSIDASR